MSDLANDFRNHWLPFTANRDFAEAPRLVAEGKGIRLKKADGGSVIDAVSGLFCTPAGLGRTEIADAVAEQLNTLSYVTSFQHGHGKSFELASRIAQLTPGDLDHVFFGNSGSEAVETALKIALAYQSAKGEPGRTRLVGRERAYHGVNFGGLSVGGIARNKHGFSLSLPGVVHMRHTWLEENKFSRGQPPAGAELAEDLQRFCDTYGPDSIAACIVEPVAGSIGCLPPPVGYLERLREICTANGILLILDEVICGFGRLGTNFGADRFNVVPDMITMAKALTNGAIPMGAVAVSSDIYDTVMNGAPDGAIELFHGYTYTAHPAACAASLASLDIYAAEGLFERAASLEQPFLDLLFGFKDLELVTDIRGIGLLGTIDLAPDGAVGKRGYRALKAFFEAGVLVKMTGDSVLLAPPFVASEDEVGEMLEKVRAVIEKI
ncbi:MAG TPA: aspartate aminotransferase family protein [Rhodospirillaceae bacterium]|nr:aspartate aminotransferase family protein [Rhodospirillaceae bacterium]HAT35396.1 aspartate aminotransferase family protein [Rhodospirillaceae bacterium]